MHKILVALLNLFSKTWRLRTAQGIPCAPAVIAFWHGKMLPAWKLFSPYNPVGIVSQSKDGAILSALLSKWNFRLIRGSSSRDPKEVLASAVTAAADSLVLLTPDGPRGPVRQFKSGAAVIAFRSSAPLYLCSVSIKSKFVFRKSWDCFELPLPFSLIEIKFSDAINIPPESERETIDSIIADCNTMLNNMEAEK